MRAALEQAQRAAASGEVPVGAVLVRDERIISEGYNQPISTHDPTAHAEIIALRAAGIELKSYRLNDCIMYVTLEPCAMCATAIIHARLRRLVFAAWDPKAGAGGSVVDIFTAPWVNHRVDVFGGVMQSEAGRLLSEFFANRRVRNAAR